MDPFNLFNFMAPSGQQEQGWQQQMQAMGMGMGMQGWVGGMETNNNPDMNAMTPFLPPTFNLPGLQYNPQPLAQTSRPAPSAAAGSEIQLSVAPKPVQVKSITETEKLVLQHPKPEKMSRKSNDTIKELEEVDDITAKTSFKSYMEKLQTKRIDKSKTVVSKPCTPTSESDDLENSDDDFVKKPRGRRNVSHSTKVSVSDFDKMLKNELKDYLNAQKKTIRGLEGRIDKLKKTNQEIKMKLKNDEGDSDIIEISSGEEQTTNEESVRGLPMSFAWDDKDTVCSKISKNAVKKEEIEEKYNWEAEEAAGTFNLPEDDFGYLDQGDSDPKDTPFVQTGTVAEENDLKVPCKACKVAEAEYQIVKCKHIGLCKSCLGLYKNSYCRCPGCGDSHMIFLEKIFF